MSIGALLGVNLLILIWLMTRPTRQPRRRRRRPRDEFDAFKALIDQGKGIEDVAARFGVSVLTVQRRLKLATLSPSCWRSTVRTASSSTS